MFGLLVVNGYVETFADWSVAALKNVVFPVLVFPRRPIRIMGHSYVTATYRIAAVATIESSCDFQNVIKAYT
jgi:hypothetical protein